MIMTEGLAMKFKRFAVHECNGSSPLYEFLSLKIAEDNTMLDLAGKAREGQPVPNLYFGAVHYLLMRGYNHPLAGFYPSLTEKPIPAEEAFPFFVDFCRTYSVEIIELIKSKIVQTNEVRRCSYLYPIFSRISHLTQKPLALIEIGTSAGLQLFVDKYSYTYGTVENFGSSHSEVHLRSEVRGDKSILDPLHHFDVATRTGVDLHINDVRNPEDYLWLKALIWPEHFERRKLFEKAASYVSNQTLRLIEGDGVEMLRSLASDIPGDQVICVFHTHVANQMSVDTKEKLLEYIKEIGKRRTIFHIYNNIYDAKLHMDYYLDRKESLNTVGETDGHGRWFKISF
ncbi:DUF2332 domain-containing protein [Mesobacillus sp. LC4]